MTDHSPSPRALLIHRGELVDLREHLQALGFGLFERAGALDPGEARQRWDLVVTTPLLVPELPTGAERPTCIAVVPQFTRTLEARLRREGVDFVLRRPFHPVALRLLVLRALYRGPERRRDPRVPIGANVRLQSRLRGFGALLVDLSEEGCRLHPERPLARGQGIRVVLGRDLTGGRRLVLRGTVDRPAGELGEWVVRFGGQAVRTRRRLAEVLTRHQGGPAALADAPARATPAAATSERRRSPRRPFSRRVIALGDEAARVLVGRDLSLGGMRVEPGANLQVGELLRLAVHGGGHEAPVLVDAEVLREEAERGYVLRFVHIDDRARAMLEGMLCELPSISDLKAGQEEADLVLSQIVAAGS